MLELEALRILVIHEDPNRRARLREMNGILAVKGVVKVASAFKQAVRVFHEIGDVDAVFLSSSITVEELETLTAALAQIQPNKRPYYILTLRAAQQSHDIVANFSIRGVDAFLQEPFSSGEISNTLTLLKQARDNPAAAQKKLVSTADFVYQSAVSLIDAVSIELIQGKGGGYAIRDLRRLGPVVKELYEKLGAQIFDGLLEHFMKAECTDTAKYRKMQKKKKVQHPGVMLKSVMEKRGLTAERLAGALSAEEKTIVNLLECTEAITEDLAKGLSHLLGETPRYWLALQQEYDKYRQHNSDEFQLQQP